MARYDSYIALAQRLIRDAGGDIELAGGEPVYDPNTFTYTTPVGETVTGFIDKYNREEKLVADSSIKSTMKKILIAEEPNVEVGGVVKIQGTEYQVIYKDVIKPDGVSAVLTTLIVGV